jgi:hypothetical protein
MENPANGSKKSSQSRFDKTETPGKLKEQDPRIIKKSKWLRRAEQLEPKPI